MAEPRQLEVDGHAVRVRVDGPEDGTPLLLLHGIGRSLGDWAEQHDLLADRFRLISVDLPGFGESAPRPVPPGSSTLAEMAEGIAATLGAVGETRPVTVVGNSLGGAVALYLLAAHSDRIARLVLVDSAGFGAQVSWLLRMLTLPGLGLVARRTTQLSVRLSERAIFVDRAMVTRDRLDLALAIGRRPGGDAFQHALARELGTSVRGVRPQWRRALLASLATTVPTLVVWGARDKILPRRHLDAALAAFPVAESWVFPDTGHMPQIERPAEFAQLLAEFVSRT